jgi:HEAT repeat protein
VVLKTAYSNASAAAGDRLHAANNLLFLHSDACFPDVPSILQSSTDLDDTVQALQFCSTAKHELDGDGSPTTPVRKKRNQLALELVVKRVTDPIDAVRFMAGDTLANLGDSSQAQILQGAIAQETNEGIKASMQRDLEVLLAKPPANDSPQ